MRNIRSLRLFGRELVRVGQWTNDFVEAMNARLAVQRVEIAGTAMRRLLLAIDGVLIVYLGARQVLGGAITVGMMFAFLAYRTHFRDAVLSLVEQAGRLHLLRLHLARLGDLALAVPEPVSRGFVLPVEGRVRFHGVSFTYPGERRPVLAGIELDVSPGEALALLGASGCGKSTLVKLLLGLVAPDHGGVFIDGYPVGAPGTSALRGRLGTVLQDDQLFSGTLAENISFFDEAPDAEGIERAARIACIHDDIVTLPMGYGSRVGEMAVALSAGQQQRILIARAVYRQPALVVLDEGTANIDSATAERVLSALAELGVTRIFVTHDGGVAAAADRRLVLERGRLFDPDHRQDQLQGPLQGAQGAQ